jgi:hypothetical protein
MPNFSGIWTVTQQMQATGQSIWPARPATPTIGTATATGATTATVAFTAGSTGYPTTVTFTATSSPGGLTGTGTSPITVTGLTTGTAYTFTVTATNATGTSAASAASNSITPVLQIGDVFGGGYFAGQISTAGNSVADYNLVVGPRATAQSILQWKTSNTSTAGTSSVINGPANSTAMNDASHPAAQFCEGLTIGGYTDWYMPAKNELELFYYNFKSFANTNNTTSGSNTNAVPSRASNYTGGNPARTTVTLFQGFGSESFTTNSYWSSTESTSLQAWSQDAYQGYQSPSFVKDNMGTSVRAIRRVAV